MIWTPYFTIGHIGRTGGDSLMIMLCATLDIADPRTGKATEPNLKVTAIYGDNKHRPFDGSEPCRVLGIRRLPSYVMSIRNHMAINARVEPWDGAFCCQLKNADDELKRFTHYWKYSIDRWIRAEYMRDDVAKLLTEFYKERFTTKMKAVLYNVVTKDKLPYNRNVYDFFTEEQLITLYRNNPIWADYERELYGTTLCS